MAAKDAPVAPLGTMSSYIGSGYGYGSPGNDTEHIPDLHWPASIAVYGRMRRDPVVSSILAAYTGPLLAADWRIDPRGADPRAVKIAADSLGIPVVGEQVEDIGAVRRRGVHWVEHARLAALHLVWGHMAFYPYYEVRPDGFAYLAGLPERMPSTIIEMRVNDDGTLKSIVQEGVPGKASNSFGGVELPAKDLLYYVHSREGANWAGTALIRPCYSDWLLKVEGKRANAVGLTRFAAGTPIAEPLPGTNPTPAQIAEAQRMVSSIRVGQTGGAVPVGFKIRIIGIEGTLPDALATLRFYNEEIRTAALASVLDLGSSANGSRALGETFADLLKNAIQGVANSMAETATQLCERLTTMNFGEDANSPAVIAGDVGASKAAIVTAITGLVSAGIVTADEGLEGYAREGYHLPPKDPTPAVVAPAEPPAKSEVALAASGWQPWVHAAEGGADKNRGNAEAFRRYWTTGPGAALIGYGSPGQFDRCVAQLEKHMSTENAKGYCALRIHEVTGEWPGAHRGKVRAAEATPPEPTPYREPTPQELAAGIDPQQIDAEHEDLVAEGLALFAAVVLAWGAALAAQILAALTAGSLVALARLKLRTGDAVEALQLVMHEAASVGVRQVLAETERAGARSGITEADVTLSVAELDDTAEALAEHSASTLAGSAGREAARLGLAPDEAAVDEMLAQITTPGPVPALVSEAVARAMASGRTAAMASVIEATPGIDWEIFASAVRDGASCSECLANDGRVYPDLTAGMKDFPLGLFKACLGRTRCRCLLAMRPVKP